MCLVGHKTRGFYQHGFLCQLKMMFTSIKQADFTNKEWGSTVDATNSNVLL